MKKRLISIVLAVVMLAAMIPAFAVTASAADPTSYKTTVTSDNVYVDGDLDDAYKNSHKIVPVKWHTGTKDEVYFEAYTVMTINGLYVWAEIKDNSLDKATSTPVNEGDKFQVYIKMDNGTGNTWGWYETDYNGKKHVSTQGGAGLTAATTATQKLPDGSGWRSELFIPYGNIDPMNITSLKISIGLQVNNEVDSNNRHGLCFDHSEGASFWSSNANYIPLSVYAFGSAYRDGTREKTAVYVTSAPSVDGTKDASYSDHGKITIRNIGIGTGFTNDARNELGDLYLSFTNDAIYAYYEVYDKDLTSNDYCQFYYCFNNAGTPVSGYFCTRIDPNGSAFYGSTGHNYGYPGTAYTASNVTVARKALGNNKYGVEVKIPIPAGEKQALATNGKVDVKLAFSANDYADYTPEGTTNTRRAIGGCSYISSSMYEYNAYGEYFPELTLSKSFTNAAPGVIEGASVALGSDISVNYHAMVCPEDIESTYMKFIRNGKETIAYAKAAGTDAKKSRGCVFTCENIAPQAIGDNIRAELYVNGVMVAAHDGYSVLQNCTNLYNNSAYSASSYNNMKWLVLSLMNYGAAAQKYADYKTDALVNANYEIDLLDPESNRNVRSVGAAISSSVKMTALGVYFDSANKVYVKFTAPSLSGITVTFNGEPATIQKVDGEKDVYIAYSKDIPVLNYGVEQRIVLTSGTSSQVALYSVNSYAFAKKDSADSAMAQLAKAMYTYGEYARTYSNMGLNSYTVMTINDGDSNYQKNQNYKYVAQVINYYAPDLVGMQEVQKAAASGSNANYAKLLDSNYGIIYYKHGYPTKSSWFGETVDTSWPNAASEKSNEYGNVILYRKDKFDVIDKGQQWLSNTPDKASRVEGSEYTRSYVWAKLRDMQTGEEFVFVSTHLDYVAATYNDDGTLKYNPRLTQTQILLSLTEQKFGDLPIVYTADWNFGEGTDAYKAMNAAGYVATEKLMAEPYKPASTIDFCFVNPDEFSAVDYKYINEHDFGEDIDFYTQVTDHPMILTEIVPVKDAPALDLPTLGGNEGGDVGGGDVGGDIVDDVIRGPFESEDEIFTY